MGYLRPTPLHEGDAVVITFRADATNGGSSLLLSYYRSQNPDEQIDPVAPGGRVDQHRTIRAERVLRVEVDVPDAVASGRLSVRRNGEVIDDELVWEDVVWSYVIL